MPLNARPLKASIMMRLRRQDEESMDALGVFDNKMTMTIENMPARVPNTLPYIDQDRVLSEIGINSAWYRIQKWIIDGPCWETLGTIKMDDCYIIFDHMHTRPKSNTQLVFLV